MRGPCNIAMRHIVWGRALRPFYVCCVSFLPQESKADVFAVARGGGRSSTAETPRLMARAPFLRLPRRCVQCGRGVARGGGRPSTAKTPRLTACAPFVAFARRGVYSARTRESGKLAGIEGFLARSCATLGRCQSVALDNCTDALRRHGIRPCARSVLECDLQASQAKTNSAKQIVHICVRISHRQQVPMSTWTRFRPDTSSDHLAS